MARMIENSNYVDLIDPVNSITTSSVVHPEYYVVGVSGQPGVCWIPSKGNFFCFIIVILFDMVSFFLFIFVFLDVVFDTFEVNIIFDMITGYIRLHGDFRVVISKHYYGTSGRGKFPDIFNTMDLNTEHCSSWPQSLTFECMEIRKRKNNEFTLCPFCILISFGWDIGHYVIKRSILTHEGHVLNQASISGHASYESDLSDDEENQLAKFGKMGSTDQNTKNDLTCLFQNRTYDSSFIYLFFYIGFCSLAVPVTV